MQISYAFRYPSDLGHYTAEAFVVRCFDDRFWKTFKNFLKQEGVQHIDPESVAGGAKVIASPEKESDREFMLRELEKSILLHHVKKVMLFTHYDCGAYGGLARFNGNEAEQFAFHQTELAKAKAAVQEKFPEIPVETYFIDAAGVIKI